MFSGGIKPGQKWVKPIGVPWESSRYFGHIVACMIMPNNQMLIKMYTLIKNYT